MGHDVEVTVEPDHLEPGPVSFREVDADAPESLVAMMDATDRWPAVRAARSWVLGQAGSGDADADVGSDRFGRVLDVGSGPGTFGSEAGALGWSHVDLDRSSAMLHAARLRADGAGSGTGVLGDVAALPFADGAFALVHCERVLQWADDPSGALAELWRITGDGGLLAVTDTDWGTLVVDDPSGGDALSTAALGWVTHPRLARSLPRRLADMVAARVEVRADAVTITEWDPDDPAQADGPPGLPLRSIAAGASSDRRPDAEFALRSIADRARAGQFFATLTIVTTVARRGVVTAPQS